MRTRLTSSHLVGRVGELSELELAVSEAACGRPVLVLLGGDSGVGKTRLVGELAARLEADPETETVVLRGGGVEQVDGELPYAPLLSALRPLVRSGHPALDAVTGGSRAQLAAILPGLDDDRRPEPRSDPTGQLRLFEALLELLDVLGESTPVVLVLEDVHWADRSTRNFIAFLARSLRQERLVLALTYRTDELHRRHPLRPLLAELDRLGGTRRIDLAPFDREELSEALADILGGPAEPALVERLFQRGEGNPLYTEELLVASLDGRGPAPQSLRDAFLARIERLSDPAQRVARVVAVGRALPEPTIAAVAGMERVHVQDALREALAEQVLITDVDERFCFRHALLREALHDDLLPGERGELHLALARALEVELGDGEQLPLITSVAGHYAAAGDQPAALRSMVSAAAAADRAMAHAEAAQLSERALELWPRLAEPEALVGCDHVDLLYRASCSHWYSGERSRAEILLRQALGELDDQRDPARYAAMLARLARMLWALNRGGEAVETGERALALLPAEDALGVRPALMAWLARTKFLRGRFRQAASDGEVALDAAVRAGDVLAQTELLNTLGMVRVALGRVEEGVTNLRRAIELASEHEDIDSMITAYSNLADMFNVRGRTEEALATAQEGMAATPRRLVVSHDWLTLTVSEMAFSAGDWGMAEAHLDSPPSRLAGVVLIVRHLREAELALGLGDQPRASESLNAAEPLVAVSSEPQWIGLYGALRGELLRRGRDLDGARRAVEGALDRLELCTDDVIRIAQVTAVGVRVEADRAQRARDLRERGGVRDALARVRIHVQRLEAAAQEGGPVERAHLSEARADMVRARGRSGAPEWTTAAGAWQCVQRPYPTAVARWREAEALVAADERGAAADAAREALSAAVQLGSRWLLEEIRGLAERARLDIRSPADPEPPTPVAADPFGLTPRECQVLTLLAEGATNRQIGAALFMAEKTASVHVSRILAKLGVQRRTEAAAVAHRQHLA
ncbi:MAG: AAA family ATPase [Actinomycetota bacterium]|nr:AAA family ATPase [Actinomycetota bacterium]